MTLCCTDQQPGEVSPRHPLSCEANVLRPSKLQHAVQRRDSNGHLGRLPPFGPRAQRVTDHGCRNTSIANVEGAYPPGGNGESMRNLWPQTPTIVVLTGAGIWQESGLATFRDADGIWQPRSCRVT
jgi:hypothetical protein